MPPRIAVEAARFPATADEVGGILARLGDAPGVYFGCDAGIAGMHPSGASLLVDPLLALRVHENAVRVEPLSVLGARLLSHPALAQLLANVEAGAAVEGTARALIEPHAATGPDDGAARDGDAASGPVEWLERFLAAFEASADLLLIGAFGFEAHRLAVMGPTQGGAGAGSTVPGGVAPDGIPPAAPDGSPLGVLYLGEKLWRRAADGQWQRLLFSFPDLPEAVLLVTEPSVGDIGSKAADAVRQPASFAPQRWEDDFAPGGYAQVVARAVQRLGDAGLVSLTLSQSFRRRAEMAPATAFARLRAVNPAPVSFFLNTGDGECLFGASPDLQLRIDGRSVEAMPVCGTVARGAGAVGEAESFKALVNEEVDEASLAVCSDALRNDLAPLCEAGSLTLVDRRRQMSLATVVHAVDRLRGRLRDGVSPWRAIFATAAPVMVTGTPRAQALAAIAALEAGPRRWYGGLMVQVAADGCALAGTILRAASMRDGHAEVRTGGDLLADSDPPREEHESRLKAISLWRALGLSEAGTPGAKQDATERDAAGKEGGEGKQGVEGKQGIAGEQGAIAKQDVAHIAASLIPPRVALLDAGDAFAAGMADTLAALGVRLDAAAGTVVLIGGDDARLDAWLRDRGQRPLLAIGAAAAVLLERAGFEVRRATPEHGRLVRCIDTPQAPWSPNAAPWLAGRYAGCRVPVPAPAAVPHGWQVWAGDAGGGLQAAGCADAALACLLFRPDSLLSSEQARQALRSAIDFVQRAPGLRGGDRRGHAS